MAAITPIQSNQQKGRVQTKKLNTHVDLTPMVDLGFLLITFFIFTTALTTSKAHALHMPAGDKFSMPIANSTALTLIPGNHQKIFYYHGELSDAIKTGSYGYTNYGLHNGVGDIIRKKKSSMDINNPGSSKKLMMIIFPTPAATLQNIVDLLDERTINDVKHYVMVDHMQVTLQQLKEQGIIENDF